MKIIAELCQNHNGNVSLLEDMVNKAAENGATHVKIQNIYAKNLTFRPQFENGLIKGNKTISIKRPFLSEYKRLKKLELSYRAIEKFINTCNKLNVIPLTTCFTRGDVIDIKNLGFKEVKVASYDCASFQMIRELAKYFNQVYISTGATFENEIKKTVKIFKKQKRKMNLLHCVTKYPTEINDFNLLKMQSLKRYTPNIGLSDHSLVSRDGIIASKIAIYLGAKIIERHFTILSSDKTKDGPVSITADLLKELFDFSLLTKSDQKKIIINQYSKILPKIIGNKINELSTNEILNRDYYRGRFATPREIGDHTISKMIMNWEETDLE